MNKTELFSKFKLWSFNFIKNKPLFLTDESGQSTTEYILILAVVVMVAMKFKTMFTSKLGNIITDVGNNIDSAVNSSSTGP